LAMLAFALSASSIILMTVSPSLGPAGRLADDILSSAGWPFQFGDLEL
jgi:hypothetical protein